MSQKVAMNETQGILFNLINMAGMTKAARCTVQGDEWLEGGQGEVRGACD